MANQMTTWEEVPRDYYVDITTLPHRYFFELVVGERQQVVNIIEAPFVSYVGGENQPAYVGTYTINSHYEEHEGFRRRVFKLAGRSGFTPSALTFFHRFRVFFENLMKHKRENKNAFIRGTDYRLVINAPFEGLSDYCNLLTFGWERDRSRFTLSYVWTLTVETIGFSARKWKTTNTLKGHIDKLCTSYNDTCHAAPYHFCRKDAVSAAGELPPDITNQMIGTNFTDVRSSLLGSSPRTKASLLGLCDSLEGAKSVEEKLPIYQKIADSASTMYNSISTWWRNTLDQTAGNDFLPYAVRILGWLSNLTMEAKVFFGLSRTEMIRSVGDYVTCGYFTKLEYMATRSIDYVNEINQNLHDIFNPPNNRPIDYVTNAADDRRPSASVPIIATDFTVVDVSTRLFGTRDYAGIIAAMNNMADYRTWSNGQPLSPGDNLLVPALAGITPVMNNDGADLLGADWKVKNYDFVLTAKGDDFERVVGIDAFRQNTAHRLMTAKGENPAFPTTGITAVNQGQDNELTSAQVAAEVQDQIIMDPRTGRIVTMSYTEPSPSTVVVDVVLEPVSNSRWSISFTYTG